MNRVLFLLVLVIAGSGASIGQTADRLIIEGRDFLVAKDLTNANARFAAAVAKSPSHQTANALYAVSRLLSWPYTPTAQEMMDRLGMPLTNRSIYRWTADLPRDTNGVAVPPNDFNSSELVDLARTNALPEITAGLGNLAKVTDPNFILNLASNETTIAAVTLDYGDVQMLRCLLHITEFLIYTVNSHNLSAQLNALYAMKTRGELTIDRLLANYPQALTFANTSDLPKATQAFRAAVDSYVGASEFIRARPTNIVRLFNYDSEMADQEAQFRQTLTELKASLDNPVSLTYVSNKTGHVSVNLSRAFDGVKPLRSLLPTFQDGGIVVGSLPDPTFNDVVFGLSESDLYKLLGSHVRVLPKFRPVHRLQDDRLQLDLNAVDGRNYAIEASTNLVTWVQIAVTVSRNGVLTFLAPQSNQLPWRFYRARDLSDHVPSTPIDTAFVWAQSAGGLGTESGEALAVDSAGNCYITGTFQEGKPTAFGAATLAGTGTGDGFVAKYDAAGAVVWAKQIGGDKSDTASGAAADNDGSCYVVGSFQGTATFGVTRQAKAQTDTTSAYIAKFDRQGNTAWVNSSSSAEGAGGQGRCVSVDASGNSYLVGHYNHGTMSFGSITLTNESNGGRMFIVKFDRQGNSLWATQSGGNDRSSIIPNGIALDAVGNGYVTAQFGGAINLGDTTLASTPEEFDFLLAKIDERGKPVWATRSGPTTGTICGGIAVDPAGNCYVTGSFKGVSDFGTLTLTNTGPIALYGDIFIAKYDTSGNLKWARQAGGPYFDYGWAIALDSAGDSYITGSFSGPANFSGTVVNGNGVFVAKYDPSGELLWVKKGESASANGRAIAVTKAGDIYVTGAFLGTAVFGPTTLANSGVVGNNVDIFLFKLANPGCSSANCGQAVCCGIIDAPPDQGGRVDSNRLIRKYYANE